MGISKKTKKEEGMIMSRYCSSCGKEVNPNAVVCVSCGVALEKKSDVSTGLLVLSYIMAVLMPIVGVALGIYCMCKSKVGSGVAVLVISLFFWFFWYGFFSAM